MKPRLVFQIAVLGLCALIFISAITAFAADMEVSDSDIGVGSLAVTANELKPDACASLDLTNIVRGAGAITGTSGNDLILGSSDNDTINGMGGTDCILGNSGEDVIDGGDENDVCIGGSGGDTFSACEAEIQ